MYKKRRLLVAVPDRWRISRRAKWLDEQTLEVILALAANFSLPFLERWRGATELENGISYNFEKLKEFFLNIIQEFWRDWWKTVSRYFLLELDSKSSVSNKKFTSK